MGKLLVKIFIMFFLFQFYSCTNNSKKSFISKSHDKYLLFPENYSVINYRDTCVNLDNYNKAIKIVHLFDGDCGFCLNQIKKWSEFIDSYQFSDEIDFIFFTYSNNYNFLEDFLLKNKGFDFLIFGIERDEFLSNNDIPENTSLHTFLLIEDKIKVIGSPIDNAKMQVLYKDQIIKYFESDCKIN
jgi:hypothetical protein